MNITIVKNLLARYGLAPLKKFGQNFLTDGGTLEKILAASGVGAGDCVLEIGPGLGALTAGLLARGADVVAVEVDKGLAAVLGVEFHGAVGAGRLRIVEGDVLKLDLAELLAVFGGRTVKAVANLPYYITTPVIMRLLEAGPGLDSITVMIQKEVAQRMAALPGTKAYGSLTLAVQYWAEARLEMIVPAGAFHPRPEVESAVITLQMRAAPPVVGDREKLFAVIQAAFATRRKTLVNALHAAGFTARTDMAARMTTDTADKPPLTTAKAGLAQALESCGLRADVRGEALSLAQFSRVAEVVHVVQGVQDAR